MPDLEETICTFAYGEGVAIIAGRTLALIAASHIPADCIESTSRLVLRCAALIDVLALARCRIPTESTLTDAHVTSMLVWHTHLRLGARQVGATGFWGL